MAFSSVRENVTPNTQLELCWKMLLFIILYIDLILIFFYLIPSFQVIVSLVLCLFPSYINRCYCCIFIVFYSTDVIVVYFIGCDDKPIIVISFFFISL